MKIPRKHEEEAELDITAFMNLMIVLVPVLLMSMVFKHITVLELNIPELSGGASASSEKNKQLEVIVRNQGFEVYYPSGVLIKRIPALNSESFSADAEAAARPKLDYKTLSLTLQEIKRQFNSKSIEKNDVLLLSDAQVDYQTLVSTMDTVRSFKTVVAANLVEAELFPEISLGDAPIGKKR